MSYIADAAVALHAVRPGIKGARRQLMLGQAKVESNFGYASNFHLKDGRSSNNWGAIYATGTCGTIEVSDTYDGKPVKMAAANNCTAQDGAQQFASLIEHSYPEAWAAAASGDLWGYSKGLWRNGTGYYAGFPPGH